MKGLPRSLSRGAEQRQEIVKKAIRLPSAAITITDPGAAVAWGTSVIEGLPEGNIKLLAAVLSNLEVTKGDSNIIDAFDGDVAVGTAPSTDNSALTGTLGNVIPSTALQQGVAGVSSGNRGVSTATEEVIIDNTAGSAELNLNVLIDDASISANSTVTLTGTLHVAYIVLGDD